MLLLAPNAIETFEVLVGCARAGLVTVPVNWRLSPGELAAVAADAGARLVVVDPSRTTSGGPSSTAACRC